VNYLAHLYLAEATADSIIGNMCADFLFGTSRDDFAPGIQIGIQLHQNIDAYTDSHDVTRRSKKRLSGSLRHFSHIAVDVLYDHFLAKNWAVYSPHSLEEFIAQNFITLQANIERCPPRFQEVFPRMKEENWLLSYRELSGIHTTLKRIARRLSRPPNLEAGTVDIERSYRDLESDFLEFFPQLCRHVQELKGKR
jgi:acyl carrier protein phosphodiesterase